MTMPVASTVRPAVGADSQRQGTRTHPTALTGRRERQPAYCAREMIMTKMNRSGAAQPGRGTRSRYLSAAFACVYLMPLCVSASPGTSIQNASSSAAGGGDFIRVKVSVQRCMQEGKTQELAHHPWARTRTHYLPRQAIMVKPEMRSLRQSCLSILNSDSVVMMRAQ